MKKLLSLLMCGLLLFGCGDKYDDSALRNDLNDLENRVAKLEELCKQMNTNISSLQKIEKHCRIICRFPKLNKYPMVTLSTFQMVLLLQLKTGKIARTLLLLV